MEREYQLIYAIKWEKKNKQLHIVNIVTYSLLLLLEIVVIVCGVIFPNNRAFTLTLSITTSVMLLGLLIRSSIKLKRVNELLHKLYHELLQLYCTTA